MELDQTPQTGPGLCGSDRELFQRVWRRVMPEGELTSPIEVLPVPAAPPAPLPPAVQAPAPGPEAGPASDAAQLQLFLLAELRSWRSYQGLARRVRGRARQTLTLLADHELRHARRLSAAHFLLSGVRYWPMSQAVPHPDSGLLPALRDRFRTAQEAEWAYRAAAQSAADACVSELFQALAQEENGHAWMLRELLETL